MFFLKPISGYPYITPFALWTKKAVRDGTNGQITTD
jgi:hypothetical protein